MGYKLPRDKIIRGKKNFDLIFRNGKKINGNIIRSFVLLLNENNQKINSSFGIKVSRNIKRAIDRNRIKRIVRETLRLNRALIDNVSKEQNQIAAILFFYPGESQVSSKPSYCHLRDDVIFILNKIGQSHFQ
ncbi:MAG: ribonuclease P protein component [Ignavibacteriales bacterium]|nr:ribonuclease P protein component [Ignavibacteriales bacterium]